MKILHMADMHIGKIVLEQSMLEDQEYMLKQIIEIIKSEKIEAVLISGDIYDRSIPSADAVSLLNSFLRKLIKDLKIKVFIIAGNHDSKERLNFGSEIFIDDGLYIVANYDGAVKKFELEDEFGVINFYMLPYVKPIEAKQFFEEDIDSYNDAVKMILDNEKIDLKNRNIILSHQFVTACGSEPERSESETISLGGTENVDISCYDKFDYVALGHIHGPQRIGRDTARYAGTMLKYSFSEVNQKKSLTVVSFKEKDNIEIKQIPLKPLRDMRIIKGPLEELIKKENYIGTNREDYIKAEITNEEPIYDAIGQIKKIYPNTLRLEIKNSKTAQSLEEQTMNLQNIKKKSEVELFNEFYKFQNNIDLSEKQFKTMEKIIKELKKEGE